MKKTVISVLLALLIMLSFLEIPTAAATLSRVSERITSYNTDVFANGDGKLKIQASVTGIGIMNSIGIKEIRIYTQSGDRWILDGTFSKSDDALVNKKWTRK